MNSVDSDLRTVPDMLAYFGGGTVRHWVDRIHVVGQEVWDNGVHQIEGDRGPGGR
ncbi:MAG: hypothetical protein H6Q33_3680 [Deltaproteobacteria bacterium]|nr:hypothetical protein [Deltaproteobacteria bacterium]